MIENLQIEPPLGMSDHVGLFLNFYVTLLNVTVLNAKFCGIKVTIIV